MFLPAFAMERTPDTTGIDAETSERQGEARDGRGHARRGERHWRREGKSENGRKCTQYTSGSERYMGVASERARASDEPHEYKERGAPFLKAIISVCRTCAVVHHLEVLIFELPTVDRLTTCPIHVLKIAALHHEALDHAVLSYIQSKREPLSLWTSMWR